MAYQAEISRTNPSCIIFLIDQSGSMSDAFHNEAGSVTKAHGVADSINRLLQNIVIRNSTGETVIDRFHIGVIGYGAHVGPAFNGALQGRELIPLKEVATAARVEIRHKQVYDNAGGLTHQEIKFPVWFDPVADGSTPMHRAIEIASRILSDWLSDHPNCFPPIVMNITDGEPDHNPSQQADRLKALSSSDGNVLFFNAHIADGGQKILYPNSGSSLPGSNAKMLFQMSSVFPDKLRELAKPEFNLDENARGFVYNGDLVEVIQFLDIGTRVALR